jgi:hypothetical protein
MKTVEGYSASTMVAGLAADAISKTRALRCVVFQNATPTAF